MFDYCQYNPEPATKQLGQWLHDANALTRTIIQNLASGQEHVPQQAILNPPYWEFAHMTWFHEFWLLRKGQPENPTLFNHADRLFNSSIVAHADRWNILLPPLEILLNYNSQVYEKSKELLNKPLSVEDAYFIQLTIHHYDMHNEAFAIMWQTLEYPIPFDSYCAAREIHLDGEFKEFPQTTMTLGSTLNQGFIFDNEKWQHSLMLEPFAISMSPVTNGQYREFVLRKSTDHRFHSMSIPKHWKYDSGIWFERAFDQWNVMNERQAVRHIHYEDAKQYCAWRNVRLPTEAELTLLMGTNREEWEPSDLWEWTSSHFLPFNGFVPDPYDDYSKPWFDCQHKVLKGWGPFTAERMRRLEFRNFYQTERSDIFCGFRVCRLN